MPHPPIPPEPTSRELARAIVTAHLESMTSRCAWCEAEIDAIGNQVIDDAVASRNLAGYVISDLAHEAAAILCLLADERDTDPSELWQALSLTAVSHEP